MNRSTLHRGDWSQLEKIIRANEPAASKRQGELASAKIENWHLSPFPFVTHSFPSFWWWPAIIDTFDDDEKQTSLMKRKEMSGWDGCALSRLSEETRVAWSNSVRKLQVCVVEVTISPISIFYVGQTYFLIQTFHVSNFLRGRKFSYKLSIPHGPPT